ncbi:beta-galactosidase [Salinibacterium sp. ZJ70]|uniref:beta-galactosidase n=1 Tax=Salinibacterium sp. ZJ70 TaxID=2708084 RepID=UPI001423719D|nr:beta-galactosidase [Salinibacterium sp. ZJ70]
MQSTSKIETHEVFTTTGVLLGCDYNPEQWDRDVWREDVALMSELGIGIVAINIFGWASVNPAEGVWDFESLDAIIELLHENGIRLNLGTGTASPAPWLTAKHPELLPVADDGTTRFPGGRQAWCPSSPVFREHALELAGRIAERYGSHPALALWHVSNELGCHNVHCHCETSTRAFRDWLKARYGTVEALNDAWGTSFWSQRYSDFEQILTPMRNLSFRNPGQALDFRRFSSDELLDYYRAERAVIRQHSDKPVTTNFMVTAHIRGMDYWTWAPEMDVIANDHYLDHRLPFPNAELSFSADATRGLAQGEPWFLMETAPSAVNWQPHNIARPTGGLLRSIATHVARGADAICFFQWRASVQGSEKFHSALVPHAGTDSRHWREVSEMARVLGALGEVVGTRTQADVALVFSWESWWAADGEPRPSTDVHYLEQVHAAYIALRASGVTVDILAPGASLEGYRLAVIPMLHILADADAAAIEQFVAAGGTALVTYLSGVVDAQDRVELGGYPGKLREVLGLLVEEFAPVLPGTTLTLGSGAAASTWAELVTPRGADVIDTFADGPVAGEPALTRHTYGEGEAWYLATTPSDGDYAAIVARIARAAGATIMPGAGRDVEVVRRADGDRSFLFVINHGIESIDVPTAGVELITGETLTTHTTVPAGAVRIIKEVHA